jgi:DNA processing protein
LRVCARATFLSFDIADYIALALLPVRLWRSMAEQLRAGIGPRSILERTAAERWRDCPDKLAGHRSRAARLAERAHLGVLLVPWGDPRYPPQLTTIVDPPPVLWVRGSIEALARTAVAIVGSRAGSPYALAVAERLATDLASRGVVIVSGLARGVDAAAHRGALQTSGSTIGVLGSGIDVMYPREHDVLARDMCERGALVSELVPGTPPQKRFFPQRNRIISGLARAVVVIEAGERSGSLITARMALEQGRDVLAVPGNVLTGRNRGAHGLLRDGAKIVETADDILEELRVPRGAPGARPDAGEDPVLGALPPGEACDLDGISGRSGLDPSALLPRLLELELQGIVRRVGGGRFLRFDRPC